MRLFEGLGRVCLLALLAVPAWTISVPGYAQQAAQNRAGVAKIVVTAPAQKTGAGIVVRRDATEVNIVTAAHVVSGAEKVEVQFYGRGRSWPARTVHSEYRDLQHGLALLRVSGSLAQEVKELSFATAFLLKGGEEVSIIGHQRSAGDWGVLNGNVTGVEGRDLIIAAPIDEGTSGGPVLNSGGGVVGMVQQKDPSGNFGYAVMAKDICGYLEGHNIPCKKGDGVQEGDDKNVVSPQIRVLITKLEQVEGMKNEKQSLVRREGAFQHDPQLKRNFEQDVDRLNKSILNLLKEAVSLLSGYRPDPKELQTANTKAHELRRLLLGERERLNRDPDATDRSSAPVLDGLIRDVDERLRVWQTP